MRADLIAVPAATLSTALPHAVTIAVCVTLVVALGMVVTSLRRSSRLTRLRGVASVVAISALVTAGVLAAVTMTPTEEASAEPVAELQLPTLPLD